MQRMRDHRRDGGVKGELQLETYCVWGKMEAVSYFQFHSTQIHSAVSCL